MQLFNKIKKSYDFDFSKNTTYGLGGKAKLALFPETEEEAVAAFDYAKANFEKFEILGNGSNILVSDEFYDGAVISTKRLNKIYFSGNTIKCQSGVTVSNLVAFCINNGVSGLEYLAGIPASIGGLALMNGGINSHRIGEDIRNVTLYDGNIKIFSNSDCNFGIKHSTMRDISSIILNIGLNYVPAEKRKVGENVEYYKNLRISQPKGKSCGCVFKNPDGLSAGKLIDEAGLKGFEFGCASVSNEHANFIINKGNSANDIYALISIVKRKVFEIFGVLLEEEVIYIGEFNDFNC